MSHVNLSRPRPEVPEKATRQRFTVDYKLQVPEEADRRSESGQVVCCFCGGLFTFELTVDQGRRLWQPNRQRFRSIGVSFHRI